MIHQFVYPFNLETHVLSLQPQPHEAISQRRAKNAAILHQREVEEEQKEYVPPLPHLLFLLVARHLVYADHHQEGSYAEESSGV